jgi:hypothetical protein
MEELGIVAPWIGEAVSNPIADRLADFHKQYPWKMVKFRLIKRELPFNSQKNQ